MLALLLVPILLLLSMLAQRPVSRWLRMQGPLRPLLPFPKEVPWRHRFAIRGAGALFTFTLVLGALTFQAAREQRLSTQVKVAPGLAADQAGVKTGDVLTAIDGSPVRDFAELKDALLQPPLTRTLTLQRGTERLELTVTPRDGLLGIESIGEGQPRSPAAALKTALRRLFVSPLRANRAFLLSLSLTLAISYWLMVAVELIALVAGALRPGGGATSTSRGS